MLSMFLILLIALVIFGPRKLLHVATNMAPAPHSWQKLMSVMTAATDTEEPGLLQECTAEPERETPASAVPLSPVKHSDSEQSWPVP
jgi:Sec-independent protein translocase protein TatA